jgi:hypothetical protein
MPLIIRLFLDIKAPPQRKLHPAYRRMPPGFPGYERGLLRVDIPALKGDTIPALSKLRRQRFSSKNARCPGVPLYKRPVLEGPILELFNNFSY